MIKRIKKKIKSQTGETLTEVLVASLVVVLGSILLATMVSAAFRMIRNSEKAYDRYLTVENAAASHSNTSVGEVNSNSKDSFTATYSHLPGSMTFSGKVADISISGSSSVNFDTVTSEDGTDIFSYSKADPKKELK